VDVILIGLIGRNSTILRDKILNILDDLKEQNPVNEIPEVILLNPVVAKLNSLGRKLQKEFPHISLLRKTAISLGRYA